MSRWIWIFVVVLGCSGVDGLNGEDGVDGEDAVSTLIDLVAEPAGQNCATGGFRIDTGRDLNGDGTLGFLEIERTQYVCNGEQGPMGEQGELGMPGMPGADGVAGLVSTSSVGPGAQCAGGGVRIDAGLDDNNNDQLDGPEITSTQFVCNGADGHNGLDGQNGQNGTNGLNALTATTLEVAGPNCAAGGVRIQTGLDANRNNLLDTAEVSTTRYVCNGSGSATSPVVVTGFGGFSNPTFFANVQASTIISASITFPSAGRVLATGSADVFCETDAAASQYDCATADVQGYLALTSSTAVTTATQMEAQEGHVFFYAAKDVTNNLFTTRVFDVTGAGTQTFYLRLLNANNGELGAWRQRITLMWIPN